MRKSGWILGAIITLAGVIIPLSPVRVLAAECANVSSYGAVRMFLPDLSESGEYVLWLRVQSPDATARVLAEVGGRCLDIVADTPLANQWVWQAYEQADKPQPLSFGTTTAGSIKLYGVQDGVKVDKVLLAPADCTPVDFGENCRSGVEALASSEGITPISPPSDKPVAGEVVLSTTPDRFASRLKKVTYTVGGRTLQQATKPQPFDTTLVDNGKHTVIIETTLNDGEVIRESTVIEVDNPLNAFSPLTRWLRLNRSGVLTILAAVGSVLAVILMFALIRRWYMRRRELRFHGF